LDQRGVNIDFLNSTLLHGVLDGVSQKFNVRVFHVLWDVRSKNFRSFSRVRSQSTNEGRKSLEEGLHALDNAIAESEGLNTAESNIFLFRNGRHVKVDNMAAFKSSVEDFEVDEFSIAEHNVITAEHCGGLSGSYFNLECGCIHGNVL